MSVGGPGAVHGLCAAGSSRVLFSAERVDCLLAPMSDLTKRLVGVLSNTCVPVPKSGTAVDQISPATTAGARVHARVAWVRGCVGGSPAAPSILRQGKPYACSLPFRRFALEGASASRCQRVASRSCPPKDFPTAAPAPSPTCLLLTAHCSLPTLHAHAHSSLMPALARSWTPRERSPSMMTQACRLSSLR